MRFSKFFQYAYLVFAVLFLYDAYEKYTDIGEIAYGSLILGVTAIFMFFFKRNFSNKYKNNNSPSK